MTHSPAVSVIMAVHNGADLIGESLDSLFAQTFADFELIVVDDGSTDRTPEILARYNDRRLRVISVPVNRGVVHARNVGLQSARGRWIAINDHDDLSAPQRLASQVAVLTQEPQTVLVGAAGMIQENGRLRRFDSHDHTPPDFLRWLLLVRNPLIFSSVMMRADVIRHLPHFMDPDYECAEDFNLYHELQSHGVLRRLSEPLVTYRLHGNNMTRRRHKFMVAQTERVLANTYRVLLGDDAEQAARLIARHIMAKEAVPDALTLGRVGESLQRLADSFIATYCPDQEGADRVKSSAAELWWQTVRNATRAGHPELIHEYQRVATLTSAGIASPTAQAAAWARGWVNRTAGIAGALLYLFY